MPVVRSGSVSNQPTRAEIVIVRGFAETWISAASSERLPVPISTGIGTPNAGLLARSTPRPIPALQTRPRPATLSLVARRRDRQRREARRAREHHDVHGADPEADPEPFDREKAISHWQHKLATMTGPGFVVPPFAAFVFGPVVSPDLIEKRSSRR
jgi:hypothetical protein